MPIQNCLLLCLIRSYKKTTFNFFVIIKKMLFTKSVNLSTGGRLLQVFAVRIFPCYSTIYPAIVTILKQSFTVQIIYDHSLIGPTIIAITVHLCDYSIIDLTKFTFLKQILTVRIFLSTIYLTSITILKQILKVNIICDIRLLAQ